MGLGCRSERNLVSLCYHSRAVYAWQELEIIYNLLPFIPSSFSSLVDIYWDKVSPKLCPCTASLFLCCLSFLQAHNLDQFLKGIFIDYPVLQLLSQEIFCSDLKGRGFNGISLREVWRVFSTSFIGAFFREGKNFKSVFNIVHWHFLSRRKESRHCAAMLFQRNFSKNFSPECFFSWQVQETFNFITAILAIVPAVATVGLWDALPWT